MVTRKFEITYMAYTYFYGAVLVGDKGSKERASVFEGAGQRECCYVPNTYWMQISKWEHFPPILGIFYTCNI